MLENINWKETFKWTGFFLLLYLLSYLAYLAPILNSIIYWLLFFITLILTLKKFEYGVYILLIELFIGAKGYMFSFDFGGFVISIRILLFCLVMFLWVIKKIIKKNKISFFQTNYFIPLMFFCLFVVSGIIMALINGNNLAYIFFDVNGYFYFVLVLVIFEMINNKDKIAKLLKYMIAGSLAVSFLTLFLFINFRIFHAENDLAISGTMTNEFSEEEIERKTEISHAITAKEELKNKSWIRNMSNQKSSEYRWIQDTGLGEITYVGLGFFRIFTIAQIYVLFLFLVTMYAILTIKKWRWNKYFLMLSAVLIISGVAIIVSLSRSLWLGLIAGLATIFIRIPWRNSLKIIIIIILLLSIFMIITGTVFTSVYDIVIDRINSILNPSSQSSSVNRINLYNAIVDKLKERPLLGLGFGTTVEYESVVPGLENIRKVYAFEWSYLDIALKMGILGLFSYLWLLWIIFISGVKKFRKNSIVSVMLASFVALVVLNITTPYLNHPLGIGLLIICMTVFYVYNKDIEQEKNE